MEGFEHFSGDEKSFEASTDGDRAGWAARGFDGMHREAYPLERSLTTGHAGSFTHPYRVDGQPASGLRPRIEKIERDARSAEGHARESLATTGARGNFEQIIAERCLPTKR